MSLPYALAPGTVISSHYIVHGLINSGGFGAVYRGIDTSEGNRPCAIKETYDVTPAARRHALMEAGVLFTLRSKHLPEIYDAFEANGRFYLVMQLIEGQNLLELMRSRVTNAVLGQQEPGMQAQGPCTEEEVLRWLLPIMQVLQEMHSRNPAVIHRDIKPANIILTPQQTAVLVDFGLTRLYDPAATTHTMVKAVSEGFSPIEQYMGKTGPQSDIYALSATMYFLLTNRMPPTAIGRSVKDELLSPRLFNAAISTKTEQALLKGLALYSEHRFQTMREFIEALSEPSFTGFADPTIAVSPAQFNTQNASGAPLRLPAQNSLSLGGTPAPGQPSYGAPPSFPAANFHPSGGQPAYGYGGPGQNSYIPPTRTAGQQQIYQPTPNPYSSPQAFSVEESSASTTPVPAQNSFVPPGQFSAPNTAFPVPRATPPPPAVPQRQQQNPAKAKQSVGSVPGPAVPSPSVPPSRSAPSMPPVAPQMRPVFPASLPSPFGQGCLWGLLQGIVGALIVLFLLQETYFYLAIVIGLLSFFVAGITTTWRGGSTFRGLKAGYWAGITSTVFFWLALGLGLVIRFALKYQQEASHYGGAVPREVLGNLWKGLLPALPDALLHIVPNWPPIGNVGVVLVGGLVVACLLGWIGGLFGASIYRDRTAR